MLNLLEPCSEADIEHAKRCAARALLDPRATFTADDMATVFRFVNLLNWKIDTLQKRPVPGCGHVGGDGCCVHPKNITPECHEHICPLLRDDGI